MRFETNALSGECNTVKCAWFVKTTLWPAELFAAFQDSVWCHPYLPGGYYHVFIEILQPQPVVEPLHTPHRQLCWQKQIWKSSFLKCDPSACCSSWKRGPLSLSHVAFQPFSQKTVTALLSCLLAVAGFLWCCGARRGTKPKPEQWSLMLSCPHVHSPFCFP